VSVIVGNVTAQNSSIEEEVATWAITMFMPDVSKTVKHASGKNMTGA
jgi:hypothetical protein